MHKTYICKACEYHGKPANHTQGSFMDNVYIPWSNLQRMEA